VHYSTDFVFDGKKTQPYLPEDEPNPLSAYGRSKRSGEQAIIAENLNNVCIIRTAWLFGPGRKNFVDTILNKAASGSPLRVVNDQIGSPTFTEDLARYSFNLVQVRTPGIFHIVNQGAGSWYDLARAALKLKDLKTPIIPVKTKEFPMKATRPKYSTLHTKKFAQVTGVEPRPWSEALADYLGA
jgi:dTDP-4-dehydrorhamnose reductase